jgi:hypothetical protein
MRHRIIAAAIFTVGLAGASQGAEVSEQGAKDLRGTLTHFLSHDLADSGFLSVKPTGNRYEITYDLAKFFDKVSSSDFSIAGLKPLTMFAEPAAKGLWNIDGDNSLDISAHSKMGNGPPTDLHYALASLVYSGVFDPAISYLRSLDVTARDLKLSSAAGPETIEASAAGLTYKLSTIDTAKSGTVDMLSNGTMPGFYEKITGPSSGNAEVKADQFDFNAKATGVPVKELRDLLHFVFEHVKAKKLSKSGSDKFERLVRDALPLFVSLDETATANNLSVVTDMGKVGLSKLTYSFKMDGLTKASSVGFGLRAENLKLDSSVVPAGYAALVPDTAVVEVGIPDMNFAAAADILLQTDFSSEHATSAETGRRIEQAVFPNDRLTIDFPEISAISSVYDVDVSGKLVSDLQQTSRYALQMSVLARDYDKTIAFVQNAAKSDPELNQISFVMMMAKGFAKTDPDGRQRWDLAVAEDGTFSVNGQVMTAPK